MSELAPHGEANKQNEKSIEALLQGPPRTIYALLSSKAVLETCAQDNIDPYNTDNPVLWEVVAEVGYKQAKQGLAEGRLTEKEAMVAELVALTPDFIFSEVLLNSGQIPKHDEQRTKHRTSYFKCLIGDMVKAEPELNTKSVATALLGVARITLELPGVTIGNTLKSTIRGIQHELGFGQILGYTTCVFRPGTIAEDMHGIDYLVDGIGVDVKASLTEIASHNKSTRQPFALKQDGNIVAYSCLKDEEFAGRFLVAESVAQERASTVQYLLSRTNSVIRSA